MPPALRPSVPSPPYPASRQLKSSGLTLATAKLWPTSHFILTNYTALYPGGEKPPPLFLLGEQRRDIIPNILGTNDIIVDELIVYKTGLMESFEESFKTTLLETEPTAAVCSRDGDDVGLIYGPAAGEGEPAVSRKHRCLGHTYSTLAQGSVGEACHEWCLRPQLESVH
ncbi:MAG: hypothetical protein M1840_001441 [Geoglossum simile]|nr:MAG: hypothetical protein M1840_001441 [Geoglossum simile]